MEGFGMMEDSTNEIYMLCRMSENGLRIYGSYTDRRILIQAYELLTRERQNVFIYRFQMNEFPVKNLTSLEECTVDIREVRSNVKVSEFYGCKVFCDLDFKEGAFFDFTYDDDRNVYHERVNLENDVMEGDFDCYCLPVLEEWYNENKPVLMKMWQKKALEDIPEWEE